MKIKGVWIIFFLAIISLLIIQSIWLYNTYNIKKKNIEEQINSLLIESVKNETTYRYAFTKLDKNISIMDEETFQNDSAFHGYDLSEAYEVSDQELFEAGLFQHVLQSSGLLFNINTLDSILQDKLQKADIPVNYSLYYKDSIGTILEQAGNFSQAKTNKVFHTGSILIVDGKKVQAVMNISPSIVFKQMKWLLIISFFVLIILLFCIIYQTKTIFTQRKLNQLRDDFTHALTHDMKTPLGSINTVLSHFRSGSLDDNPEIKERFGKIAMDQVSNLLLLVEKILTIAKLEQGKLTPERSITNIHAIIKELEERFSVSNSKPVTIRSSVDIDENKDIYLDETLIKEAVGNLMENAIKYSGNSVKVTIDCYTMENTLRIRVIDNGFGIPQKDHDKIFEKFERGAAIKRKGAKGFGLGLNYVKRVTEAHGGIVTLFSKEGEGSEFTLVLPLDRVEDKEI
jgi:two-component system phosphate regulon sensor histidine kinase PhoR